MARRKGGKRGGRRSVQAAYLAGIRRGKALAALARHRQAVAAGKKSGAARREKKKKKKEEAPAVGALVLYEASLDEAAPLFVPLPEWPVTDTEWAVHVQLLIEGAVMADDVVTVPAGWEEEPAGKAIRRAVRVWYDQQLSDHPTWKESPRAIALRLTLAPS